MDIPPVSEKLVAPIVGIRSRLAVIFFVGSFVRKFSLPFNSVLLSFKGLIDCTV